MIIQIKLTCPNGADVCLARMRGVLDAIDATNAAGEPWPMLKEWERRLPSWFVAACGPETLDPVRPWIERSEEEKATIRAAPWSLPDWLHWLQPSEQCWRWVDAKILGHKALQVSLEVDGLPVALGAFEWLATASGATEIDR
jgi:hypothetical protein